MLNRKNIKFQLIDQNLEAHTAHHVFSMVKNVFGPGFAPHLDDNSINGLFESNHHSRSSVTFLVEIREERDRESPRWVVRKRP